MNSACDAVPEQRLMSQQKAFKFYRLLIVGLLLVACGSSTPDPDEVAESVNATLTAEAQGSQVGVPTEAPPKGDTPTDSPSEGDLVPAMPVQPQDPFVVLGEPDGLDNFDTAENWSKFNNECFANDIENGQFIMEAKGMERIACWTFSWPQMADYYLQTEVENLRHS